MSRTRIVLGIIVLLLVLAVLGISQREGALYVNAGQAEMGVLDKAPTPTPTEFSIVAYNVQARPVFDDSEYKFARMPKVLNPFDIAAFQELFKDHELLYSGLTQPAKVYHGTLADWYRIVGSGLGIVGRYHITNTQAMNFTHHGDGQNKPASKGVLMVQFNVGGNTLDVYTTHKAAGRQEESTREKPLQAQELVAFVKKNSKPENAVIVLGDFNLRFKKEGTPGTGIPDVASEKWDGMELTTVIGNICASLELKDLCSTMTGEPNDAPDHILFRSGTKAVLTPLSWQSDGPEFYDEAKEPLSDHVPVIGRFKIVPVQ